MTTQHKILVADDDRSIVELVQLTLESDGYKVFTAHDGSSALEKINKYHPDLLILDVMMPGMDGYDVSYLSGLDKKVKPKTIIITVKNREIDRIMGKSMGADVYINKPFDIEVLRAKVKELLTKKK